MLYSLAKVAILINKILKQFQFIMSLQGYSPQSRQSKRCYSDHLPSLIVPWCHFHGWQTPEYWAARRMDSQTYNPINHDLPNTIIFPDCLKKYCLFDPFEESDIVPVH